MNPNYQKALLYLTHLVISADGVIDDKEKHALNIIRKSEGISEDAFNTFTSELNGMEEKDVYYNGIDLITKCSDVEKLRAFAWLYKMAEVDGRVHIKEVRFLLYSVKMAGVDFDDVVAEAAKINTSLQA